ncbi:MAG: hypothetical protein GVY19_07715 [Bacteroidetes bacterium]|jgi:hypothetical protein|nr:hypothetical protein [Bacteroidota bacterium]
MSLAFEKNKINSYFRLMKNWDIESKKDLIIKLTQSINDKAEDSHDFSSCFGAWDDERSADEIIDDIRNSRINNREIEEF